MRRTRLSLAASISAALVVAGASAAVAQFECHGVPATIVGTSGSETRFGTEGDDVFVMLGGSDTVAALGGDDLICGGDGNDFLLGMAGDDVIDGQSGSDFAEYLFSPAGIRADLEAGTAVGEGFDELLNIEDLLGSRHDDVLRGDDENNFFRGLEGDDDLSGREGGDLFLGDLGDDVFRGGPGDDDAFFASSPQGVRVRLEAGTAVGEGSDILRGINNVFGSEHDDVIVGDDKDNILSGLGGDDELWGRGGVLDSIEGGTGSDRIFGGASEFDFANYVTSSHPVRVDLADESADDGTGKDVLVGIEGVAGSHQDDVLRGDGGDNILDGSGGDDQIDGRAGDDLALYILTSIPGGIAVEGGPVDADLIRGIVRANGFVDNVSRVEGVWGSEFADVLRGDRAPNFLKGAGGQDVLMGGAADDYLDGGDGADVLRGGAGRHDLADYFFVGAVRADVAAGTATAAGNEDSLAGVESIGGSRGLDVLRGDHRENLLLGEPADDVLVGRAGDDVLDGKLGDDRTSGGEGFDHCPDAGATGCEASNYPPDVREPLDSLQTYRQRHHRLRHH